jgi:kinesin family protein 15
MVESKPKNEVKQFSFDQVFDEKTKQEELFNILCNPLLEAFFQGYNCTIFAYGQTGSGKTHTMLGQLSSIFNSNDTTNHGLIPRILNSIFSRIEEIKKDNSKENKDVSIIHTATIKCSCLELYQEQFIDLLNENNSENLHIREDVKKGMYVEGVMEKDIDSVRSALELILLGLKNRHIAATNMNPESSRSHLIFTIFLNLSTQVEGGLVKTRNSRLHLIDLAGSERQKSTGTIGERLKEAGMINK